MVTGWASGNSIRRCSTVVGWSCEVPCAVERGVAAWDEGRGFLGIGDRGLLDFVGCVDGGVGEEGVSGIY